MELTQQQLDLIVTRRDSNDTSKKLLKQLQKISNLIWNTNDNYCMCSNVERRKYKVKFYDRYDS